MCREFETFKYLLNVFFLNKLDHYLYLYIRNLENLRLNPVFRCTIYMYTKFILCSRKIGVKCAYLRFLIYKDYLSVKLSNMYWLNFCLAYLYQKDVLLKRYVLRGLINVKDFPIHTNWYQETFLPFLPYDLLILKHFLSC